MAVRVGVPGRRGCALACAAVLGLASLAWAEPVTVGGRVVGPEGQPVAEAEVWVLRHHIPEGEYGVARATVVAESRTDAAGSFSLAEVDLDQGKELGAYSPVVLCYKEGLALGWQRIEQPVPPLEITLEKPRPIRGTILDLEGNPVPDVKVKFVYAALMRETEYGRREGDSFVAAETLPTPTIQVDEEGAFSVGLLPADARLGVEVSAPGRGTVIAMGDAESPIGVGLGEAVTLEGRLVCAEPAETAGISISLMGRYPFGADYEESRGYFVLQGATADEQGRFRIEELPPAAYEVGVPAEATHEWQAKRSKNLEVKPGGETVDLEIEMARAWPVSGRVVDAESGEPIGGAKVTAHSQTAQQWVYVSTEEDGSYLLHVLPPTARVTVIAPQGYYQERGEGPPAEGRAVEVRPEEETVVDDFRLRRAATVKGVVVNERDELVAGAEVWEDDLADWDRGPKTVSDEQGQFELTGLPPDETVQIYAATESAVTAHPVSVNTGEQGGLVRVVVSEAAVARVRVRVVDDRGEPIEGAEVTIRRHGGGEYGYTRHAAQLRTDEEGRFESPVLMPDGEYSLRISGAGIAALETERWLAGRGEVHELGDIVVARARGRLAGVVVDVAGQPLAGVSVFNAGDGPQRVTARTDAEGRFELTGLWEGAAYAFAEAEGHRFAGVRAETGAQDLRIVLHSADGPRPEASANPPALDLERDKRLAEEVALEGLEITRGAGYQRRDDIIAALVRVNPTKGLEVWQQEGGEREARMLEGLVDALLETNPDEAIERLWNAEETRTRASQLVELGRKLAEGDPERAAEAFSLAASAARAMGTEGWGILYLARAGRGLMEVERPEGREVLEEAFALAQELEYEKWEDCYTRGEVAEAMCLVDLEAALSLLEGIPTEGESGREFDRHMTNIACLLASRDPDQAQQVLSQMRGGIMRVGGRANVAYEMAAKDPERALKYARGLQDAGQRALAVGYLALRFAETDKERAFDLIDEAVQGQADAVSRGGHGDTYYAATKVARLAHVAAGIGYPDVRGLVMRAMSLRPREDVRMTGGRHGREAAEFAQGIAWVDTEAARHLLAPALAEMETDFEQVRRHITEIVMAAAVVDPEWALEIARGLPDDEPGAEEQVKAICYRKLAEHLSLEPEARLREMIHFWMPGNERH